MDIRYPVHPDHGKKMDTSELRKEFLIQNLFVKDQAKLTYSHVDRIITAGICPAGKKLSLDGAKELASEYFFERREGGVVNIGGAGKMTLDGREYEMNQNDGFYIGMGTKEISFTSNSAETPAKFYLLSGPAHKAYPSKWIPLSETKEVHLGSLAESNERTIHQYVHPAVVESCQLCMGMTILEPNCIWNTMPVHTHERRMEVYMYFNMEPDTVVFHLMGTPDETRHVVMRNEEAIISPSWSIHSGAGTRDYTFIWGMVGENQTFTDMDGVDMKDLK
ncbi:MAG: 5-dehydro-4-deoxy-D-glucuronate isomerase [Spirochaetales bacterium]|uniref:4-deoxy-L-threo-5-hexosulose-uronate ketol-isomerase n=1 Tax=Candidatus Thalassospirochaeta sargassi TaxID=3119039 RepID=A0AAJ1ICQ7_9SPIO|nr:5-dehydro-4-deoxy-D-glucuronate isomerase [Spirochaetales bacterium]